MRVDAEIGQGGHVIYRGSKEGGFVPYEAHRSEIGMMQEKVDRAVRVVNIIREFVELVADERADGPANAPKPMTPLAIRATALKEFLYPEGL